MGRRTCAVRRGGSVGIHGGGGGGAVMVVVQQRKRGRSWALVRIRIGRAIHLGGRYVRG